MEVTKATLFPALALLATMIIPVNALAVDYVVYSEFRPIDLGNPGEAPQKDYYVNMGSQDGLTEGATLDVIRKFSTYDLMSEKLYKDVQFPIARLKVIHVEPNAAIARLEKILPADKTPSVSIRAVMVGDIVQISSPR